MPLIERTLTIRAEPLEWILSGHKVWEMRSRPTRIRGRIVLSEKGAAMIKGTCSIVECRGPLTFEQVLRHVSKMGVTKRDLDLAWLRAEAGKKRIYAWVLSGVRRLRTPVRFQNPSGAVTFSRVPARVARRVP